MTEFVSGPIEGGDKGWPFAGAGFDLAALGYIEEEYFITGSAPRYVHAAGTGRSFDGRWAAALASHGDYRVRVLVRRPADPSNFNGTGVVMWNNVSIGYEILTGETRELYEGGFALVAAGVQNIGIHGYPEGDNHGLRAWDPARYGSLHVADDSLSYGIFSAVARHARVEGALLGPLRPARLLAFGVSQSATRLATYLNAIEPIERLFDGYLLDVYFGTGAPLAPPAGPRGVARADQIAAAVKLMPQGEHLLRDDLPLPVFVLNSESEATLYRPVRQPDTARFRLWEVAGVAHGSERVSDAIPGTWQRDLGISGHPLAPAGPKNALTLDGVRAAGLRAMHRWMAEGIAPPIVPRIEFDGDPPSIVRDRFGNACGGVRLPDLDVPTAMHTGVALDASTSLFGTTVPFGEELLRDLYPDDAYRERYSAALDRARAQGVIV